MVSSSVALTKRSKENTYTDTHFINLNTNTSLAVSSKFFSSLSTAYRYLNPFDFLRRYLNNQNVVN